MDTASRVHPSVPELPPLGRSRHGHAVVPWRPPRGQTATVSDVHRQLVHINLNLDVLEHYSARIWALFSIDRSESHTNVDLAWRYSGEPSRKQSRSLNIPAQWQGVQCRDSVRAVFGRFGRRSVRLPDSYGFFDLVTRSSVSRFGLGSSAYAPTEKQLPFLIFPKE